MSLSSKTHSRYRGFVISKDELATRDTAWKWFAIDRKSNTFVADTIKELRQKINDYLQA